MGEENAIREQKRAVDVRAFFISMAAGFITLTAIMILIFKYVLI